MELEDVNNSGSVDQQALEPVPEKVVLPPPKKSIIPNLGPIEALKRRTALGLCETMR